MFKSFNDVFEYLFERFLPVFNVKEAVLRCRVEYEKETQILYSISLCLLRNLLYILHI